MEYWNYGKMGKLICLKVLFFTICLTGIGLSAEDSKPKCRVLIIGGLPGSPVFAQRYQDWIQRFRNYFVNNAKVPADQINILSGDKNWQPAFPVKAASLPAIKLEFIELGKTVKPNDQFVLIIIGHGATLDDRTKLALSGRDLSVDDIAKGLAEIKAKQQIILYLAGGSGDSIDELASSGRILVCATSPNQIVEPVFAEFFLNGLETKRADGEAAPKGGEKDGTVTLLEAYNWAADRTAAWIRRIRSLENDKWQVDGKESIDLFKKLYVTNNQAQGSKNLDAKSNPNVKDPIYPLTKVGADKKQILGLRIIMENAMLEDAGEKEGLSAVRTGKYQPLTGIKNGEPGAKARLTVLGRPRPL